MGEITGLPSSHRPIYFPLTTRYVLDIIMGFSIYHLVGTVMTHCSLLKCSGLLPAYLTLPFYLWFYFYDYSKLPIASPFSFDHCCCGLHTSTKTPWKGSFAAVGSLEASSFHSKHFGKQGQVQGNWRPNYDETLVQLLAQLCAILNWSITSKTQLSAQPSLVQHSCWSNIFGNSHYLRNECSCVFIANRVPALSTIKEIRIQQTYSSSGDQDGRYSIQNAAVWSGFIPS